MGKGGRKGGLARSCGKVAMVFTLGILGIGAVVVALGISAWFQAMDAEDEAPGFDTMQLAFVSRMVFFMGCLTALLALIGLYGKRAQKAKVLQAYAILIFVVCIMQLAMGIWLYTVEVTDDIMSDVERADSVLGSSGDHYIRYQKWGDCCYWKEFPDWGYECHITTHIPPFCKAATKSFLEDNLYPLAAVSIAGSCLQLIGTVCTIIWVFGQAKEKVDASEDAFHY